MRIELNGAVLFKRKEDFITSEGRLQLDKNITLLILKLYGQ